MNLWHAALAGALVANALLGVVYRLYRLARGGPRADVTGQAILAGVLLLVAGGVVAGAGWARWVALAYGVLFGVVVMPLWLLAVFIPMRPRAVDRVYAVAYWAALGVIVVAAVAG